MILTSGFRKVKTMTPVPVSSSRQDDDAGTCLELSTPEEKDEDDDDEVEVSEVEVNPTAYIPMLLYTSDVQHGSKLHWLQWPVKYRLLTTSHSNTGRGFQWLLMHFEHIWCYDAVFSTLTMRARKSSGLCGRDRQDAAL